MKHLRRLLQLRQPAFWFMLALNALSTALMWIVHTYPLRTLAAIAVVVFALGNLVLGLYFMHRLLQMPAPHEVAPPGTD